MKRKTIVTASRRTDIPAHYMDWFSIRLRDGYAQTRNPMNAKQVRQVSLLPDDVGCFVFFSKDPAPLLRQIDILTPYAYYLHYTLNAYGRDIEPNVPPIETRLDTFRRLADASSPQRVLWRYDPILYTPAYGQDFHVEAFNRIARTLRGYTTHVTISLLDLYAKIQRNVTALSMRRPDEAEAHALLATLAATARANGMTIAACAEESDYTPLGISRARCVDPLLIHRITGEPTPLIRDKNQRPACGCAPSVDIGAYHTCPFGCAYCYANHSLSSAVGNHQRHDPHAPSLSPG